MTTSRPLWLVTLLSALLVVLTAPSASAATVTTTKYYSYSQNRYFTSTPLQTCFTANLSGRIKVVFTKNTTSPSTSAVTSYFLTDPKLNVQARNCSTGALKTMTKWSVKQSWWDFTCSLSPSISAGYPWGITVTATPNCGSEDVANRTTTYGKYSQVNQYNSGYPVRLGTVRGSQTSRCFSAGTRSTAWVGNTSDTFNLTSYKICYSA